MKKFFLAIAGVLIAGNLLSQVTMQATIKRGEAPNAVDFYLKPSAAFSQKDEALLLAVAMPANTQPVPTPGSKGVTPNGTGPVANISGIQPNFLVNNFSATQREVVVTSESINGIPHFVYVFIFAGTAANPTHWEAGVEKRVFSIQFNNCAVNCMNAVKLVSLPNGGTSQQAYFYVQPNTLGDITNYAAPFYASNDALNPVNGGSANGEALSYIEIANVVLPIHLSSFDVAERECLVNMQWQLAGEDDLVLYMLERSIDAQHFYEIARLNKSLDNQPVPLYKYVDERAPAGLVFYRIKFVDRDGRFMVSPVKRVKVNCSGKRSVSVYPTFTTGMVNVKLPPGYEDATIRIVNSIGATLSVDVQKSFSRILDFNAFANGSYLVQVINHNRLVENVKVVLQK